MICSKFSTIVISVVILQLSFGSVHRLQSTTLQHYVLHVFKKMLEGAPAVVNLFRKDGVWELVFSEWFFYFGFGDSNRFAEGGKKSGSNSGLTFKSPWKIQKAPSLNVNINAGNLNLEDFALTIFVSADTEPLRLEVISFLELAATTSGISDNLVTFDSLNIYRKILYQTTLKLRIESVVVLLYLFLITLISTGRW